MDHDVQLLDYWSSSGHFDVVVPIGKKRRKYLYKIINSSLITITSHVNNQSWILNPLFFTNFFCFVFLRGRSSPLKSNKENFVKTIGRFRILDLLLTSSGRFDVAVSIGKKNKSI